MSTVDGLAVTREQVVGDEPGTIREAPGGAEALGDASAPGRWDDARTLSTETARAGEHPDVLTVPAHERTP